MVVRNVDSSMGVPHLGVDCGAPLHKNIWWLHTSAQLQWLRGIVAESACYRICLNLHARLNVLPSCLLL